MQTTNTITDANKKHLGKAEWITYLLAAFFYSTMTGMVGSYRNAYLVNVLRLPESQTSLFNTLTSVIPFILNFFIAMYIDSRKTGKSGKFRPLVMLVAIPMGIFLVLSFWAPSALTGTLLMIYLVTVAVAWAVCSNFGNCINMVAVVMTPNLKERDSLMSFRSIASAIGNSAPLVVVLVIGMLPGFSDNEGLQYIVGAAICGVVGIITVLLGMNFARERITYSSEKKNPVAGYADVMKNNGHG